MRLLAHANGFKSPFRSEAAEIACGRERKIGGDPVCKWSPSNPDMEQLGRTSGGSTGIATIAELADLIQRQPVGSIEELRILGHSNENFFALGGTILTHDPNISVKFDESGMIGNSATFLSFEKRFHQLRDRFTRDGKIVLAGCGSGGTNSKLLDLASRSFLVCVQGFERPIQYGMNISFPQRQGQVGTGPITPHWHITWRGRVMYSAATLKIEEVLGESYVVTDVFSPDAWSLKPDAESCVGQQILNAANRSKTAQVLAAAGDATLVGWRIMTLYFPDKASLFSGVRADDKLFGIAYAVGGGAFTLVVGVRYAQATNPLTIDQRVAEMGELIHKYAEFRRPGTVLMK